jgi:hypothetical protein
MYDKVANRGDGMIDPDNPLSRIKSTDPFCATNPDHPRCYVAQPNLSDPSVYNHKDMRLGVDVGLKYQGFSLIGELFLVKRFADDDSSAEERLKEEFERQYLDHPGIGAYVQMGYFLVPKGFELLGRFDVVDENSELRGIRFYPTMGLTYFIYGNNLKAQAQYRINVGTGYEEADPGFIPVSHDLMVMLQLSI